MFWVHLFTKWIKSCLGCAKMTQSGTTWRRHINTNQGRSFINWHSKLEEREAIYNWVRNQTFMEDPKTDIYVINDINYFYKIFFDPYCFQHMIFSRTSHQPSYAPNSMSRLFFAMMYQRCCARQTNYNDQLWGLSWIGSSLQDIWVDLKIICSQSSVHHQKMISISSAVLCHHNTCFPSCKQKNTFIFTWFWWHKS